MCDRDSSPQDGAVLDIVDQERGVVENLDYVANFDDLKQSKINVSEHWQILSRNKYNNKNS